jgi:hypothetical protein
VAAPVSPASELDVTATAVAAAVAEEYPGTAYVGSVQPSSSTDPVVLYFSTQQTTGWGIALTTTSLCRLLSEPTIGAASGVEMVVSGADGASAVRVAFNPAAIKNTDWVSSQEYAGSSTGNLFFFGASTSYEWFDELDWRDLIREAEEDWDELPTANEFPAAKLDEAAIRKVASSVAASWSVVDMLAIQSTVTIEGPSSGRTVRLTFDSNDPGIDGSGSVTQAAGMGSYVIRRLRRDPTIASAEVVLVDDGTETLRVRYSRQAMDRVGWDKFAPSDSEAGLEFFRQSTSYRWTNRAAWEDLVSTPPPSARDFPMSK